MRNWLGPGDCRSWDDAVLGVCCTLCLLMIMAWRDREGWLNLGFLGDGRVGHKKVRDRGKSSWETWTWSISGVSQLTILDTALTSPDPARTNTETRSSQPNQASRIPDFSHPLVSSIKFSSSSPISLFHDYNSTIFAEHKVKLSRSLSPWHDHELTPCRAYTQYSIHPRLCVFPSFSWLRVDPWMLLQLPA